MKMKQKKQVDLFSVINVVILTGLSLLCLMPIINVLAISFSERAAVEAGKVVFWPVDFTTAAYESQRPRISGFPDGQYCACHRRACVKFGFVYSLRVSAVQI